MKTLLKVLKWTGLSIVSLIVLAVIYTYGMSYYTLNQSFDIPLVDVVVPTDSASIAEGFRQTRLAHCNGCHGENLAGKILFEDDKFGRIVTANITQKMKAYSDAEMYRTIRHGIRKDNKLAFAMPTKMFYQLKEESILDIMAYIHSLDVVENDPPLPETDLHFMAKAFLAFKMFEPEQLTIDHQSPREYAEHTDTPVDFGKYLTQTACTHCHGDNLEGDEMMKSPGLTIVNAYDLEQFHEFFRTGKPVGRDSAGEMTNMVKDCFKYLKDEEVDALYVYLKTLTPGEAMTAEK